MDKKKMNESNLDMVAGGACAPVRAETLTGTLTLKDGAPILSGFNLKEFLKGTNTLKLCLKLKVVGNCDHNGKLFEIIDLDCAGCKAEQLKALRAIILSKRICEHDKDLRLY